MMLFVLFSLVSFSPVLGRIICDFQRRGPAWLEPGSVPDAANFLVDNHIDTCEYRCTEEAARLPCKAIALAEDGCWMLPYDYDEYFAANRIRSSRDYIFYTPECYDDETRLPVEGKKMPPLSRLARETIPPRTSTGDDERRFGPRDYTLYPWETRSSNRPTNRPTVRKTKIPTNRPTKRPTNRPTNLPTNRPTNRPTSRSPIDRLRPSSRPSTETEPTRGNLRLGTTIFWTWDSKRGRWIEGSTRENRNSDDDRERKWTERRVDSSSKPFEISRTSNPTTSGSFRPTTRRWNERLQRERIENERRWENRRSEINRETIERRRTSTFHSRRDWGDFRDSFPTERSPSKGSIDGSLDSERSRVSESTIPTIRTFSVNAGYRTSPTVSHGDRSERRFNSQSSRSDVTRTTTFRPNERTRPRETNRYPESLQTWRNVYQRRNWWNKDGNRWDGNTSPTGRGVGRTRSTVASTSSDRSNERTITTKNSWKLWQSRFPESLSRTDRTQVITSRSGSPDRNRWIESPSPSIVPTIFRSKRPINRWTDHFVSGFPKIEPPSRAPLIDRDLNNKREEANNFDERLKILYSDPYGQVYTREPYYPWWPTRSRTTSSIFESSTPPPTTTTTTTSSTRTPTTTISSSNNTPTTTSSSKTTPTTTTSSSTTTPITTTSSSTTTPTTRPSRQVISSSATTTTSLPRSTSRIFRSTTDPYNWWKKPPTKNPWLWYLTRTKINPTRPPATESILTRNVYRTNYVTGEKRLDESDVTETDIKSVIPTSPVFGSSVISTSKFPESSTKITTLNSQLSQLTSPRIPIRRNEADGIFVTRNPYFISIKNNVRQSSHKTFGSNRNNTIKSSKLMSYNQQNVGGRNVHLTHHQSHHTILKVTRLENRLREYESQIRRLQQQEAEREKLLLIQRENEKKTEERVLKIEQERKELENRRILAEKERLNKEKLNLNAWKQKILVEQRKLQEERRQIDDADRRRRQHEGRLQEKERLLQEKQERLESEKKIVKTEKAEQERDQERIESEERQAREQKEELQRERKQIEGEKRRLAKLKKKNVEALEKKKMELSTTPSPSTTKADHKTDQDEEMEKLLEKLSGENEELEKKKMEQLDQLARLEEENVRAQRLVKDLKREKGSLRKKLKQLQEAEKDEEEKNVYVPEAAVNSALIETTKKIKTTTTTSTSTASTTTTASTTSEIEKGEPMIVERSEPDPLRALYVAIAIFAFIILMLILLACCLSRWRKRRDQMLLLAGDSEAFGGVSKQASIASADMKGRAPVLVSYDAAMPESLPRKTPMPLPPPPPPMPRTAQQSPLLVNAGNPDYASVGKLKKDEVSDDFDLDVSLACEAQNFSKNTRKTKKSSAVSVSKTETSVKKETNSTNVNVSQVSHSEIKKTSNVARNFSSTVVDNRTDVKNVNSTSVKNNVVKKHSSSAIESKISDVKNISSSTSIRNDSQVVNNSVYSSISKISNVDNSSSISVVNNSLDVKSQSLKTESVSNSSVRNSTMKSVNKTVDIQQSDSSASHVTSESTIGRISVKDIIEASKTELDSTVLIAEEITEASLNEEVIQSESRAATSNSVLFNVTTNVNNNSYDNSTTVSSCLYDNAAEVLSEQENVAMVTSGSLYDNAVLSNGFSGEMTSCPSIKISPCPDDNAMSVSSNVHDNVEEKAKSRDRHEASLLTEVASADAYDQRRSKAKSFDELRDYDNVRSDVAIDFVSANQILDRAHFGVTEDAMDGATDGDVFYDSLDSSDDVDDEYNEFEDSTPRFPTNLNSFDLPCLDSSSSPSFRTQSLGFSAIRTQSYGPPAFETQSLRTSASILNPDDGREIEIFDLDARIDGKHLGEYDYLDEDDYRVDERQSFSPQRRNLPAGSNGNVANGVASRYEDFNQNRHSDTRTQKASSKKQKVTRNSRGTEFLRSESRQRRDAHSKRSRHGFDGNVEEESDNIAWRQVGTTPDAERRCLPPSAQVALSRSFGDVTDSHRGVKIVGGHRGDAGTDRGFRKAPYSATFLNSASGDDLDSERKWVGQTSARRSGGAVRGETIDGRSLDSGVGSNILTNDSLN